VSVICSRGKKLEEGKLMFFAAGISSVIHPVSVTKTTFYNLQMLLFYLFKGKLSKLKVYFSLGSLKD